MMAGRSLLRSFAVLSLLVMLVLSVLPVGSSLEVSDEVNITNNDDPEGAQRVDVDGDGNYHIAYLRDDGGDYFKLMWMKVSPSGNVLKGPTQVSPGTVESGYSALAIAVDGSGRAHIAFAVGPLEKQTAMVAQLFGNVKAQYISHVSAKQ